jgi:hypothetical protein
VARIDEVSRHRATHHAQSDKADMRRCADNWSGSRVRSSLVDRRPTYPRTERRGLPSRQCLQLQDCRHGRKPQPRPALHHALAGAKAHHPQRGAGAARCTGAAERRRPRPHCPARLARRRRALHRRRRRQRRLDGLGLSRSPPSAQAPGSGSSPRRAGSAGSPTKRQSPCGTALPGSRSLPRA